MVRDDGRKPFGRPRFRSFTGRARERPPRHTLSRNHPSAVVVSNLIRLSRVAATSRRKKGLRNVTRMIEAATHRRALTARGHRGLFLVVRLSKPLWIGYLILLLF